MKKKTIIITISIIAIIIIATLFLIILNKDSHKLKRYLKKDGYTCNSSICTKIEIDTQYQINYKKGSYRYEDSSIIIDINDSQTIVTLPDNGPVLCTFENKNVNSLTVFTEEDTSSNCLYYLGKVNREVKNFQKISVKSGVDIAKLSKNL